MFNWLKSRGRIPAGADSQELIEEIDSYVEEACSNGTSYYPDIKVKQSAFGQALLDRSAEQQIAVLYTALNTYIRKHKGTMSALGRTYSSISYCEIEALQQLMVQLMRRKLPYSEQDLVSLFQLANDNWKAFGYYRPHNALFGVLERAYKGQTLPDDIIKEVKRSIRTAHSVMYSSAEDRKLVERGKRLIGEGEKSNLEGDFDWSRAILMALDQLDEKQKSVWLDMLDHAQTATASKPSKKWLAAANDFMEKIGQESYTNTLCNWLSHIQQEKADDLPLRNDVNATVVRGLIWTAILTPPDRIAGELKAMTAYCFRKVKNVGAVSPKVGNACLYALGQFPGLISVAMLSELLQKMKYPSARRLVEKALDAAAERNHMTRDDLMEISVPDFDLDDRGEMHRKLGEITAILQIEGEQKVRLLWQKPDGKTQKSIPAVIKEIHAGEIRTLKKQIKDMQATLQAQKNRIEKLFLKPQPWTYPQWRERYLDHPLLLHMTRKLIWQLENESDKQSAIFIDGKLRNAQGDPIAETLDTHLDSVKVSLWHPVHAELEEVMAWRNLINRQEITQPFKQAHREVYLLTDAERTTEQYSNRFAAHVLKQHQLSALCQQRGWRYSLQGDFDSWNAPTLHLDQWDVTVEFYLEGVESSANDMGIFNYVSSDQVRFTRDNALLPIAQVEPIVFSETMRDVDLFIAVCSIGNDANWEDGGIDGGFNEYWREYAFGELLESANTRKEVLARLLPKLKIADQCEISGRFLVVQGKYRTYKIHLGSGNILMEPNDQYLCIVEGHSTNKTNTNRLVLPFEGDHRMSVILSKAFMLAEDTKIKDKTILSQIKRR
ncbi:MAG: DUF4132 domain-containing protein [Candidatus Thiodiazotropha sp. (ex Semelilucina semeliformis)]|nr:DUF4132 domain-containing protein [Candidatus Thiodiazotropha sp. (ex Semelilucina semeliformis)]